MSYGFLRWLGLVIVVSFFAILLYWQLRFSLRSKLGEVPVGRLLRAVPRCAGRAAAYLTVAYVGIVGVGIGLGVVAMILLSVVFGGVSQCLQDASTLPW